MARISFFLRRPNLLVFVGVNQRADALVGKYFGQQALIVAAVDDMHALHARRTRRRRMLGLGEHLPRESAARGLQEFLQVTHQHLSE